MAGVTWWQNPNFQTVYGISPKDSEYLRQFDQVYSSYKIVIFFKEKWDEWFRAYPRLPSLRGRVFKILCKRCPAYPEELSLHGKDLFRIFKEKSRSLVGLQGVELDRWLLKEYYQTLVVNKIV